MSSHISNQFAHTTKRKLAKCPQHLQMSKIFNTRLCCYIYEPTPPFPLCAPLVQKRRDGNWRLSSMIKELMLKIIELLLIIVSRRLDFNIGNSKAETKCLKIRGLEIGKLVKNLYQCTSKRMAKILCISNCRFCPHTLPFRYYFLNAPTRMHPASTLEPVCTCKFPGALKT